MTRLTMSCSGRAGLGMTRRRRHPAISGKLLVAICLAGTLGLASHARADLISIGLQETGVNSDAITTEATGSGTAGLLSVAYGTFFSNAVTASDTVTTGLPTLLNSTSLNTSADVAGTLNVFITAQGLTSPLGLADLFSSFTVNALTTGMTVKEQTFFNTANSLYGTTTPLSSDLFTAIGSSSSGNTPEFLASPFSVTEEYTITAMRRGNASGTIDLSAGAALVPEPSSIAILAAACFGLTALSRRRRTAPRL